MKRSTLFVYGKASITGLTMNKESVQLELGKSLMIAASVHPSNVPDNSFVWYSSDPDVASVDAQGTVTAVSIGGAAITAKSNDGGFTASCKVSVDTNAVDLGLSVKWAEMNLGANTPEASGNYYAWGATAPNPGGNYSWANCPYCSDGYEEKFSKYVPMGKMSYWGGSGSPDNKRELEPDDDAAAVKLGGKWRTPTSVEFEGLFKSCNTEWTTVNDVNGLKFTSKTTGNSIFLPAAGYSNGSLLNDVGEEGLYMSSSLAADIPNLSESLKLSSIGARKTTMKRYYGLTIRAVVEYSFYRITTARFLWRIRLD